MTCGMDRQGCLGVSRPVRQGRSWLGRRGWAWIGLAVAWRGGWGLVRPGSLVKAVAWRGGCGTSRRVLVGQGRPGC